MAMSGTGKGVGTGRGPAAAAGRGGVAMGKGVSSGVDERALKLMVVVGTRLCASAESYRVTVTGDRMASTP